MQTSPRILAVAIVALLAACGGGEDAGPTDPAGRLAATTLADGADPALMAALGDPILVDPLLAGSANADAVRPPTAPLSGMVPADDVAAIQPSSGAADTTAPDAQPAGRDCPQCRASAAALTLEALAAGQPGIAGTACADGMQPSARWALRLPAAAALHPDTRVIEATGRDGTRCAVRAASLFAALPTDAMIGWQHARMADAGYASRHLLDGDQHILVARRTRDGATATFYFNARDDGTAIDLVTQGGV